MVMKDGKEVPSFAADGKGKMAKGGAAMTKMAGGGMHKMPDGKMMKDSAMKNLAKHAAKPASKAHAGLKAGGFVRAADGVAKKGKTKGKVL
jgi:hypothetical protein